MSTEDWETQADRLASQSIADGNPTGWFDRLYAAGASGAVAMPWNREVPHPLLSPWAATQGLTGAGKRAVVVGSGLGADAEYVAANLLDLPAEWSWAFDLVVEVFTVQALPDPPRSTAIPNVARLVAPGSTPGGDRVQERYRRAEFKRPD